MLVVTIFAVTALSASFCVWAALDVLVVSALVFCYYKWKSSKYFGEELQEIRRLFPFAL